MFNWFLDLPIIDFLIATASFVVALAILITVHEFGHFWVARRCGVSVLRFSVGFGKRIFGWTDKQGTEFVIAAIPLGGYVKMLDERNEEVAPELRHLAFNNKTVGQRAAIVSAGPIANFLLAFLCYWLINMIGQLEPRPIVGAVIQNSIAAKAGISPNEELKSIGGIETKSWYDAALALIDSEGASSVQIEVEPLGGHARQTRMIDLGDWELDSNQSPIGALGILPSIGHFELRIKTIQPNSAAYNAQLLPGDRLIGLNGGKFTHPVEFILGVQSNPGKTLLLDYERDGELKTASVTLGKRILDNGKEIGTIGLQLDQLKPLSDEFMVNIQHGPISALYYAGKEVWRMTSLIGKEIGRLISGQRDLNSLSGPITMAKGAGQSAEGGLVSYLRFLAIISLNLGIINLFPLPVLDGGHLLFFAVEKVTGRPVSERVQDYCYRFGIAILIMLMGLAFFNDFSRPLG